MTELKTCPFCGSKAEYDDKFADLGDMFEGCIMCSNDECYAQPYVCGLGGYEYLAKKWNEREGGK